MWGDGANGWGDKGREIRPGERGRMRSENGG